LVTCGQRKTGWQAGVSWQRKSGGRAIQRVARPPLEGHCTISSATAAYPKGEDVAGKKKFNRIPKTEDLIPQLREAGIGLHVLPTYLCLLDHCNSKTGRAWPSINRMSRILGLCRRTVERHMRLLCEAGLVLRNDQQRSWGGRFSTRRYVVVAVLFLKRATVRHQGRTRGGRSIYKGTKDSLNSEKQHESREERRERERKRRWEGYEWLLG
jgi:Helix-turn-helix domain